eukprot:m.306065 g.306065  ORF g.306065 m.306065 type:complete len:329 (-) comp19618_c0_seq6:118-1104(-)
MADSKLRALACVGPAYSPDVSSQDADLPSLVPPDIELVSLVKAMEEIDTVAIDGVYVMAHAPINAEFLDKVNKLGKIKVVSNYGVGTDHINLEDCRARGIAVGHTPGVLTGATADLAWALLMACARKIVEADEYARGPEYTVYRNMVFLGQDVHHATIGIVGMGRIGEEVARRATGFRMNILYHNRSRKPAAEKALGCTYSSLEDLLRQSDYVVLVCPCTEQTTGLINSDRLKLMKSTASIINIARGPVIVTDDLVEALSSGTIASAGLDVFDPEPLPRDHALNKLRNVVMTPHRGSATAQARRGMAELSLANLAAGVRGEALKTPCA